jgi:putative hydrolase of the HAD superfamily
MTAPAAVTLDAAGTLFAPAEPVGATYARIAARHGIAATPADVARRFAAAFAAAPPLAFPRGDPARRADDERAWWAAVVGAALGVAPATIGACVAELYAYYATPAAWCVFADVPPALAALRARGCRLAVVSNFDGRLPAVLDGLGLSPSFDAVAWSTAVGAAKPDAAIFHAALAALDVPAAAALHAGDAPDADVAGARAAGLRAVLVDRTRRRPRVPAGVVVVDTLAALVDQP